MPRVPKPPKHHHAPAHSKRKAEQKEWLLERFPQFLDHQLNNTLGQFFPPLNEEFFVKWPPTPTGTDVSDADGDVEVATSNARKLEEVRLYRWMHNRTRSKHGVKGQGSKSMNLTSGPPKKRAAVQAYVKYYWENKIKQEVIKEWAPTLETDTFGEIENGEDQVAWEAMTPMEKNIPLWFRMKVGRKLYEAESKEVKDEVDRRREEDKQTALVAPTTIFRSEEERLQSMHRFDGNLAKLGRSLTNLCASVSRDFGFQTSIIVGGPIVRKDGKLSTFTYESPGTVHKGLSFSDFYGPSYDTEVSQKFAQYLKYCFPKESRKLYSLDSIPDIANPTPPSSPPSTQVQFHGVGISRDPPPQVDTRANPVVAEPNVPVTTTTQDTASLPTTGTTRGDGVGSTSNVSTIFSVPDVGVDGPTPPMTGSPMDIDRPAGEITRNDGRSALGIHPTHTGPPPETTFTQSGDLDLIETLPTLLSEDEDVRPQWLLTAINMFLRFVPYVGILGNIVDLWLAQEARLRYPETSTRLPLPSSNRPTEIASFMKWGRKYSRSDSIDAEKFGAAVVQWWLTIQPLSRKAWPPVYGTPPNDTSFDYFYHGGPNGSFLMVLCLCWWANALTPAMNLTNFHLVANDVHWVLEQIAARHAGNRD